MSFINSVIRFSISNINFNLKASSAALIIHCDVEIISRFHTEKIQMRYSGNPIKSELLWCTSSTNGGLWWSWSHFGKMILHNIDIMNIDPSHLEQSYVNTYMDAEMSMLLIIFAILQKLESVWLSQLYCSLNNVCLPRFVATAEGFNLIFKESKITVHLHF